MPKLPKLRVNYHADAQYLLRLAHAVEMDPHRPAGWKSDVLALLQELSYRFMTALEPDGLETQVQAHQTQTEEVTVEQEVLVEEDEEAEA